MNKKGFTVIELIFVVVILAIASVLFFVQKANVESAARDEHRKTAINAIHYALEETYFKENGYYPRNLDSDTLPSVDPDLFEDPSGFMINETRVTVEIGDEEQEISVEPDYRYEPTNCDGNECQSYELRATLENEDDFIRENRE